jgi:hypothetical protein
MSVSGTIRKASGSGAAGDAPRAVWSAVTVPTRIIAAARTAPAMPNRRWTATLCCATSAVWTMNSSTHELNRIA